MFDRLKQLYDDGRLTQAGLARAVSIKKWLTAKEYMKITGKDYAAG